MVSLHQGWNGVLNTSMVMVSCLYIAVGFFGYLKYGEVTNVITESVIIHGDIKDSLT